MTANNVSFIRSPHDTNGEEGSELGDWQLPLCFQDKRHSEPIEGGSTITQTWRMKERMKTVSVALVLCLNVGVDPPDVVKTQPCARLECWIDPLSMSPQKALETIGASLQKQYERWQPRARYKQSLDPTVDEVKKLCTSLRRNAKEERVLFHYNGHGVPRPTINGEVWVFNRMYTQYIPLSVYDLQTWMGAPSIYVYDCSNAGVIVDLFRSFAEQHEKEYEQSLAVAGGGTATKGVGGGSTPLPPPPPPPSFKQCIQLAACSADQVLPMNPDLPADIFTSCLTTPIKIALRWFVMQNTAKLVPKVTLELIDKIPGQLNDRRTMLGELNWIFTAITDTIAWNTLPRDLFQKLFRQDLLVASLFRNFLLAERIMRSYDCAPVSWPELPPTHQHPMWHAWDLALDLALAQLPAVLQAAAGAGGEEGVVAPPPQGGAGAVGVFRHSPFFEQQLTAFHVWLELGSQLRSPPEQLPIVLQVLLSQVHRLRALELLGRFLDLGGWAVNLALSVGIFPYVLKLLQSSARELRPLLVFIWAKILAVDTTCQADLVRDNGHKYFLSVLQDPAMPSEHRTLAAFVMASVVSDYRAGQEAALQGSLVSICLEQLGDPCAALRQWLALCLGRLWAQYDKARWCGVRDTAHEKLYVLLKDPVPEVRAAAVYALGTFISAETKERSEHANNIDQSVAMMLINTVQNDMSPLVRKELVVALQWMVLSFENSFLSVAMQELREGAHIAHDVTASPVGMGATRDQLLKRIGSRDRLLKMGGTMLLLDPAVDGERLKRVQSSSSISSLSLVSSGGSSPGGGGGGGSVYGSSVTSSGGGVAAKVWSSLVTLDSDPSPAVAQLARTLVDYIRDQVKESSAPKEVDEMRSASSLPPSPSNRPGFLSGDSLPAVMASSATDLRLAATRSAHNIVTPRTRKNMPDTISEDRAEDGRGRVEGAGGRGLVSTQFVEWSCKNFAKPAHRASAAAADAVDVESPEYYEREWRYLRNAALRREAREERRRCGGRPDSQLVSVRTAQPPSTLLFHPYESQLLYASKDAICAWDYQSNTRLCSWRAGASSSSSSSSGVVRPRVTALDYINAHDTHLVAVGSEDGAVRLWGGVGGGGPHLVTAWMALPAGASSSAADGLAGGGLGGGAGAKHLLIGSQGSGSGVGVVMAWDQSSEQLVAGGECRSIRVWDARCELKATDLPTGADSSVTCLSIDNTSGGSQLVAAGYGDGSVRLFDRRLSPSEACVKTYREHSSWVVAVDLRTGGGGANLLSGCVAGDVRSFDTRRGGGGISSSHLAHKTMHVMTAMAAHPTADIFACVSANQLINIVDRNSSVNSPYDGGSSSSSSSRVTVIKYHEWFMTARFGPVGCLAFHPLRPILAAGSQDSSLVVYAPADPRLR